MLALELEKRVLHATSQPTKHQPAHRQNVSLRGKCSASKQLGVAGRRRRARQSASTDDRYGVACWQYLVNKLDT